MNERKHVFLSYRSVEVDFALKLAADLKNAGVNLWMDRLDIKPGDDWRQSLGHAVTECAALIPVLSPEYVASRYCQRELARADRLKRPIFPVILRPLQDTEWPFETERQQFIDFTAWQEENAYNEALGKLVAILKERIADQISVAPDPETRYLTSLIAELEGSRGVVAFLEPYSPPERIEGAVRPQPLFAKTWNMPGRFALLEDAHETPRLLPAKRSLTPLSGIYEAVENHPRFVLLGAPSGGKSTVLQHLVLDAARRYQRARQVSPLPLLLKLAAWDKESTFEDFIRAQWQLDSDPIKLLGKGKLALYLDGLSEIEPRARVEQLRKWLHTENPPQRVIVTCRQSDYDSALNLDLPAVVTFDLDPLQIQEFAAHYLEPQSVHTFVEKLGDKPTNLLLLSTQIMLFKKSPQTELPKTPGAVAQCLVKELWEQRGSDSTTLQRMELALADLAFKMNDEEMPVYVPLELAQEYAGDHTLIEAAARAQLLEIRSGKVRFSQRLFLDYFAALGLMRAGLSSRLTPAQFDAQGQRIIGRWDTIVKIAADTLNNPDSIVREVAEIDPYLALECCLQVGISERVYQQVVEQLLLTMRADGDRRVAVARILAQRDAEKAVIILLDSMRDAAWEMRLAAAGVLQDITLPLLPGLTEALHQLEDQTRETTAIALRQIGKDALPTLLRLLSASEWHTRRGAAWALGELKDKAAVPLLIEALYDSDSLVSAEAALALGQIKDPAALTYLLEALDQTNWRVGKAASRALGALGKTAMTPLLEIVTDKNSGTRKQVRAIEALARIHDPAVEPVLLNATRDKNADVRSMAIEALRESKDTAVVKRLVECLHDTARPRWGKQRICDIAASVLDAIGTDDARTAVEKWRARPESGVSGGGKPTKARQARIKEDPEFVKRHPDLAHSLNDPDWMVRRDAVQSLTNIRPSGALPRMLRALNDEDAHVRVTAVQALGYFKGDVRAIAGLLQALSDKDYMVCDAAADVLKRVATAPAPEIRELINSSDVNLRGAALDILGSIRDESAVLDIVDCLGDMRKLYLSDQRICDLAAKALENIGTAAAWDALRQWRKTALVATQPADDKDVLGELIKDLHNPDWNVQQNAAKALREYTKALRGVADTSVGRRLSEMLDDDNWVVRWAAAEALAWLGEKTAVKALLRLMEDSHWMVRCAVIRVLVELGERSAQDGIIEALNDDTSNVREAAAEALGNLGDARAIPHLAKKLDDPERFVRLAAIEALGKLKVKESAGSLRRVLREHDIMLRWAAVEALGRIADPDTVPDLILCLGDTEGPYWEQKRICDIAAAALEHIDTPQARSAVSTWRESVNQ